MFAEEVQQVSEVGRVDVEPLAMLNKLNSTWGLRRGDKHALQSR